MASIKKKSDRTEHAHTHTHTRTGENAEPLQLWWGCEQAPTTLQKLRTLHTHTREGQTHGQE